MEVSRLPKDPGPAGWNRLLPGLEPAQPLSGTQKADWVIVGAGFAGLAAARRLSQIDPHSRIVVLEASRVGEGPAGRNSGFMIDLPHDLTSDGYGGTPAADKAQIAANRTGIRFAGEMAREFELGAEAFAASGKINAAASDSGHRHNLDYALHLDALGEPYEIFDAARMHSVTGTEYYRSGLFTPGTAMIQPAMFVRGVAAGLRRDGVVIHENTPVVALNRKHGWQVVTPGGKICTPKLILAVNGHLSSFGQYEGQLMHVFTYASMTRAMSVSEVARLGGAPIWGATPSDPMGTTVRRISGTGGDRIVIRNRFTFDPTLEVSETRVARIGKAHDAAFRARFPMLRDVGMEYRWGGRLCLSRNNVQIIREVQKDLFAACCQNGLGTAKGTLAGLCAAELAAGQPSAMALGLSAEPQPLPVPVGPLARIGANAVMRFAEWRAGRDF